MCCVPHKSVKIFVMFSGRALHMEQMTCLPSKALIHTRGLGMLNDMKAARLRIPEQVFIGDQPSKRTTFPQTPSDIGAQNLLFGCRGHSESAPQLLLPFLLTVRHVGYASLGLRVRSVRKASNNSHYTSRTPCSAY
jgi:hypothetical protein